jgi:predicted DNA-binding transcriptional regulator YafY
VPVSDLNVAQTENMSTSSRTLRLLSLLQTHRYWGGDELADRLEVSVRTLRRDIDRLRELGYPVRASRGVEGGYQLEAGAAMPPLLLDDDEAVALAVSLSASMGGSVTDLAETAVRALAKLTQVMPPRLRRRVEALRSSTEVMTWSSGVAADPEVLQSAALACRDHERLRFDFARQGGEPSERLVEPARLVAMGRRWYLVAFDLDRGDWRSFRVDRISNVRSTGQPFRARDLPTDDATSFVRQGIDRVNPTVEVEIVVQASADQVRQRIGRYCIVESRDETSCRVTMQADQLEWPAHAMGIVGAEFEVVGPPAFAELLREWSGRFGRAAG